MRVRLWVSGARPRTLVAAVVPVAVGAAAAMGAGNAGSEAAGSVGAAAAGGAAPWWRAAPALAVALALQVGVNYANDYSDGVRGVDRAGVRVGPARLVGSGLVAPSLVKRAAFLAFGAAGAAGLVLAAAAGWWLVLVGAACMGAAWGYTGGPRPYGYAGFGEAFVFLCFGLVATAGTAYVLVERLEPLFALVAVPVGLWAVALLAANNLRDLRGDAAAGKRTLAVRLGDRGARAFYALVVAASYAVAAAASLSGRAAWGALAGAPFAASALLTLRRAEDPSDLAGLLPATGRLQLISGLGLAAGLALTA